MLLPSWARLLPGLPGLAEFITDTEETHIDLLYIALLPTYRVYVEEAIRGLCGAYLMTQAYLPVLATL